MKGNHKCGINDIRFDDKMSYFIICGINDKIELTMMKFEIII